MCLTLPPCWGHPVGKRWVTRHTSGEMQSLCRLKCERPVGPEPRGHVLELCSSSDSPENWRAILLGLWLWDCSTYIHTHTHTRAHTHTHTFFFFLSFGCVACEIFIPPPCTEARPSALKELCPNHWATGESHNLFLFVPFLLNILT